MEEWEAYHKITKLSLLLRQQKGGMSQGSRAPKFRKDPQHSSNLDTAKGKSMGAQPLKTL